MQSHGFSLIELMITVAIVAIVAAIAIPSYSQYVRESRRSACAGELLELASALERKKASTFVYHDDSTDPLSACDGGAGNDPPCAPAATLGANQCPADGSGSKTYDLQIQAADAETFVVEAVPVSGAPMNGDPTCGTLTVDQNGVKTASGTGDVATCW